MTTHKSDCATHNAPAMDPGECDCDENKVMKDALIYGTGVLLDGKHVPTQDFYDYRENSPFYSKQQLDQAIREAREQALREAAEVSLNQHGNMPKSFDSWQDNDKIWDAATNRINWKILSLIGEGNGVSPDE